MEQDFAQVDANEKNIIERSSETNKGLKNNTIKKIKIMKNY